jgi:hypothetical protein
VIFDVGHGGGSYEGPVSFVDTRTNKRDGKAYLKPAQTVVAGVPFGRPYHAPFAVRVTGSGLVSRHAGASSSLK